MKLEFDKNDSPTIKKLSNYTEEKGTCYIISAGKEEYDNIYLPQKVNEKR